MSCTNDSSRPHKLCDFPSHLNVLSLSSDSLYWLHNTSIVNMGLNSLPAEFVQFVDDNYSNAHGICSKDPCGNAFVNIGPLLCYGGEGHPLDEGYTQWFIGIKGESCPLDQLETHPFRWTATFITRK